ncbi:MAG: NAD-dependent epimerase/dehydratase family protein [Anaerolineae bacterium]|nr:MAG: NAD-dependent epimerase/dehydratase family protein [Anaerolineae bacterium]
MILVTGAGGKTGLAVLRALARSNLAARAFTRSSTQAQAAVAAGAADCITGDLLNSAHLKAAMQDVNSLYLIAPNVHPQEFEICLGALNSAKAAGVERVVYHSVLHPQITSMPHHWKKLQVEEALIESGLGFAILQPAAYMQNVLAHLAVVRKTGRLEVPYSPETRHSLVDLEDVAEAAAEMLTGTFYSGGIYELAGPEM